MSSITIEVDDPDDAYENVQAILDTAPVDFSRVTSIRLEIEYADEAATADPAGEPADDADEPSAHRSVAGSDERVDAARDQVSMEEQEGDETGTDPFPFDDEPSIADAEGGTVSSTEDEAADLARKAEEIRFNEEPTTDEDVFGTPTDRTPDESIFEDDGDQADTTSRDSIFDRSSVSRSTTVDESERDDIGLDGVTFDAPSEGDDLPADGTGSPADETDTPANETGSPTDETDTPSESEQSQSEPAGTDTGRSDPGTKPGAPAQPSLDVSPRTYNKVMRLLQNREFPVERSAIEEIAVGAYGVDPDECRSIVDTAIEKGLVGESGPKLVDPTE
ncbi:hypothetical protein [Haloarchaeobius sp. TZWWS8]|uniref:hypothetical protein n=1 Tax=Haloarchaeobius sp. TZWWS8 TaxID=3446121 RepID=UPI003EBD0C77